MCKKVIWAQVLNVGVSPKAIGHHKCVRNGTLLGGRDQERRLSQWKINHDDLPSYHHPVPTPNSSPSFVFGTSTFFS